MTAHTVIRGNYGAGSWMRSYLSSLIHLPRSCKSCSHSTLEPLTLRDCISNEGLPLLFRYSGSVSSSYIRFRFVSRSRKIYNLGRKFSLTSSSFTFHEIVDRIDALLFIKRSTRITRLSLRIPRGRRGRKGETSTPGSTPSLQVNKSNGTHGGSGISLLLPPFPAALSGGTWL